MKSVIDVNGGVIEVPINTVVKTINGIHYLLTAEEEEEIAQKELDWIGSSIERNTKAEILRLESQITPRRIREAVLGIDNGWLDTQDSLIIIERNKL